MLARKLITKTAAGGAFDPGDLTGIVAFFDPSDLTSLYEERTGGGTTPSSVNGVVGTMRDLSGNGNHLVAASDGQRPLLRQNGALYYLQFDGTDDLMRFSATLTQPWVRVSGIRALTGVASDDQVFGGVTANIGAMYFSGTTALNMFDGAVGPSLSISLDTDYVLTERHNNTNSRSALNNNSYTTGTSGSSVPGGVTVSASDGGSNLPPMYLYGLIVANSDLPDADITSCREWCADRAGVTL